MSISGLTCLQIKELAEGYPSAIVFDLSFVDGTTAYVCTAYDGLTTGLNFQGTQYVSRVTMQKFGRMQAGSNMAVSTYGNISIDLADADGAWFAYEKFHGFLGATITAWQLFWDPNTLQTSVDRIELFTGMCDPATRSGETLTISATSNYALTKVIVPPVPIQHNCPWIFPQTYAQRATGEGDLSSVYWNCGYSPDIPNGVGNTNNGTPYTDCAKNPAACKLRGMWDKDSRGNQTGRYGGSQWEPPATWKGRSYTQGKTLQGINSENLKKYKGYIPLTYGKTWVNCPVMNVVGDPNSTRFEAIIGYGDYTSPQGLGGDNFFPVAIQLYLVNGLLVPYENQTSDLLDRWYGFGYGARNGERNFTAVYNGQSDVYGSMVMTMGVVYDQVQASNAAPTVQALVWIRPIQQYSAPGVFTMQQTDLVNWTLYDLYRIGKPDLCARIDIPSVQHYGTLCNQSISYSKLDGTTGMHRRFGVSLSIEQPASLSTIIEGLKIAGRVEVVPKLDGSGGFQFLPRGTLSAQQPNPVPGSNYNVGIASYRLTDDPSGSPSSVGYVAYDFNDSNVLAGSVEISQDTIAQTPTVLEANIQDEDNQWTPDTVTIANLSLYGAAQNLNRGTIQGLGFPNYAQAYMCLKSRQAELSMGNPRGDSLGTMKISFETSVKGIHLTVGHIIRFQNTQLAFGPQLFRVEGKAPSQEGFDIQITARWHDDRWYTDVFGGSQQNFVTIQAVYAVVSESYTGNRGGVYSISWTVYNGVGHTVQLLMGSSLTLAATGLTGTYSASQAQMIAANPGNTTIWTLKDQTTGQILYGLGSSQVSTGAAPAAVIVAVSVNSRTAMTLSWVASPTATSYSVYISVVNGFTPTNSTLFASTVSLSVYIPILTPSTTYYFRVIAYNSTGASPFSNQVSGTTLP